MTEERQERQERQAQVTAYLLLYRETAAWQYQADAADLHGDTDPEGFADRTLPTEGWGGYV